MRKFTLAAAAALTLVLGARAEVNLQAIDPTVKPSDDFFRYANGTWLKNVVMPADQARWGSFTELQQRNWDNLHGICEQVSAPGGAHAPIEQLVGNFYASGMDEAAINAAGAAPLQPEFDRIAAMQTPADILRELARLRLMGVHAGFNFGGAADDHDSNTVLAQLDQGGLGLAISDQARDADRDYYFNDDDKSKALRAQYVAHIAKMFGLLGDTPAAAQAGAESVMKLETALAQASLKRVELRNPQATYHKMKVADLGPVTGGLDWAVYFQAAGAPAFTEVNLAEPAFFKAFAVQLTQTPPEAWKAYLRWQLIRRAAPFLSAPFAEESFRFFGAAMTGAGEPPPRWKQVVIEMDAQVGEPLGQLYVAKYFPAEAKARVLQLVANIRAALRERLQTLEWMDAVTRARAVAKLDAYSVKMGYPDKWRDFSGLQIDRGAYVLNVLRAAEFESRYRLAMIAGPVDKTLWGITPPTVNAYYSSSVNGITFPAGILQPPFFDPKADDAVNYGGIGVVIGHEMTHGFDDRGRQYDAQGNLTDWWTPESAAKFKERSAAIVKQFSGYATAADPKVHLNGELTQGENIADLGGLRVSYAALQKALAGQPHDKIDGFTPEQRFFLSHASVWRDLMRPAEQVRRARVDPHSPGQWRVNGPLSNLDEFYQAFNVPEGAPMRRPAAERVTIW